MSGGAGMTTAGANTADVGIGMAGAIIPIMGQITTTRFHIMRRLRLSMPRLRSRGSKSFCHPSGCDSKGLRGAESLAWSPEPGAAFRASLQGAARAALLQFADGNLGQQPLEVDGANSSSPNATRKLQSPCRSGRNSRHRLWRFLRRVLDFRKVSLRRI